MARDYPNTYNIAYFLMDRPAYNKEIHTGLVPADLDSPEKPLATEVKQQQSRYPKQELEPIEKVTLKDITCTLTEELKEPKPSHETSLEADALPSHIEIEKQTCGPNDDPKRTNPF